MFCTNCGGQVNDGSHFCPNCGAALQAPGAVVARQSVPQPKSAPPPGMPGARAGAGQGQRRAQGKPKDPYQMQIKQLRLQIKQLRLDLQQLNQQIGTARIQYEESAPFLPGGLRRLDRMVEAGRLMGPGQKRQQLQQEIKQLEQQLLSLQQQQLQWEQQQG